MKVVNNKVYIFSLILTIWIFISCYLEYIFKYTNIINFIFYLTILIICIFLFKKEYKRDIYKTTIFKDIVIFVLLYLIIYHMLGFVIGFKRSPLSFDIISIILNLSNFVLLRAILETIKYYLIKENNSKLFLILITILFIIINVDITNILNLLNKNTELFKFLSSTVVTEIMFSVVGTYIMKNSDLKSNLLLQLIPIIIIYTIPIAPNLDWYMYSVFHIIFLLIIYLYTKYEIEKTEQEDKIARNNIISLIPMLTIFISLILFVLGIFSYVPLGVLSNSMKPIFERGDVVVYHKIKDIKSIELNDIICYQLDDIKVMHRVVKIENINDDLYFTTKGDNLKTNDALKVKEEQVIGIIKFRIPKFGYPSVWLYEFLNS